MKKGKKIKIPPKEQFAALFIILLGAYTLRSAYIRKDAFLYVVAVAFFAAAYYVVRQRQRKSS